ncbi:hypothetical protein SO802_007663 [Lithocarpus litseifolius]|uniref:DUF4283 domain-containing protein n=1 Tax=Lithocarpus litseifolius TaxID=425828 RepID=A0AAW2DPA2_9ROSI
MENEVVNSLQNLCLTKEEETEIPITAYSRADLLEECSLSLFGRLLSDRQQNHRALKSTLRAAWKMGSELRIIEVGNNTFQFKFKSHYQMEWVENSGPWNFDNNLLLLFRWKKGLTSENIVFTHSPFWVQLWGLPFELMSEVVGRDIGNSLGRFIEIDKRANQSEQAKFMRIRVDLPIGLPLCRGGNVVGVEGKTSGNELQPFPASNGGETTSNGSVQNSKNPKVSSKSDQIWGVDVLGTSACQAAESRPGLDNLEAAAQILKQKKDPHDVGSVPTPMEVSGTHESEDPVEATSPHKPTKSAQANEVKGEQQIAQDNMKAQVGRGRIKKLAREQGLVQGKDSKAQSSTIGFKHLGSQIFPECEEKLPWICFGDFNEILSMEEKLGGLSRSQNQMEKFRNVVNYCGFKDLGYVGPDFTWCNMREGAGRMSLRLDRVLATNDWINKFGEVRVHHLVNSTSDHCALFLSDPKASKLPRARRFHFESMWTKKEECKEIIEAAWCIGSDLSSPKGIASALATCAADLKTWSSAAFGQIPKVIQDKRKKLSSLIQLDNDGSLGEEINQARKEINDLLDSEEIYWG